MTTNEPSTLATHEGMDTAEAEEACVMAAKVSGKTTGIILLAESEQLERNDNGNRLGSEMSESANTPGDWRRPI